MKYQITAYLLSAELVDNNEDDQFDTISDLSVFIDSTYTRPFKTKEDALEYLNKTFKEWDDGYAPGFDPYNDGVTCVMESYDSTQSGLVYVFRLEGCVQGDLPAIGSFKPSAKDISTLCLGAGDIGDLPTPNYNY